MFSEVKGDLRLLKRVKRRAGGGVRVVGKERLRRAVSVYVDPGELELRWKIIFW